MEIKKSATIAVLAIIAIAASLFISCVSTSYSDVKHTVKNFNEKEMEEFHNAAMVGDIESVRRYMNSGVNVNLQDNGGRTALLFASRNGYTEIVKLLIDAGADVNLRNKDGWTASMIASQYANEFNLDQYGTGRLRLIKVDGKQLSYLAWCYKLSENNMKRYLGRRWDMTSFIWGNQEYWTEEVEYRDISSFPTSYQNLIQEYDVICTHLKEVPLGIHPDFDDREMYILVVDRKNNKAYFSCGKMI